MMLKITQEIYIKLLDLVILLQIYQETVVPNVLTLL